MTAQRIRLRFVLGVLAFFLSVLNKVTQSSSITTYVGPALPVGGAPALTVGLIPKGVSFGLFSLSSRIRLGRSPGTHFVALERRIARAGSGVSHPIPAALSTVTTPGLQERNGPRHPRPLGPPLCPRPPRGADAQTACANGERLPSRRLRSYPVPWPEPDTRLPDWIP